MIAISSSALLSAGLQVRPAVSADQQKIADLIFFESHVHRHLDWRTPLDWVGRAPYWVIERDGRLIGALACPPDPDSIAWIRLFAHSSHLSGLAAWSPLWKAARRELAERGGAIAAAISTQHWFESILIENGFALTQSIVLLEWEQQSIGPTPVPASVNLRPMRFDDLPGVTEVDAVAFDPLWRNSSAALGKAYSQAVYASIAEDASGLIGYQLSTGGSLGIHLARLAVRPEAQGRGLGVALVSDLIAHLQKSETSRVTVNTQADNAGSLALYRKLGFRLTGEQYPVYIYRVE